MRLGIIASCAASGIVAPELQMSPSISGSTQSGTSLILSIGLWTGATSFEIEVRTGTTNAVALARQAVTGSSDVTVTDIVGETLILTVYATGPGGTTSAVSAAFGPITAPAFEFYGAYAYNNTGDLPSSPYTWTSLGASAQSSLYDAGLGYGHAGSQVGLATANFRTTNATQPILKRAIDYNLNSDRVYFRKDLPNGTYDVYITHTPHTTARCHTIVYDGISLSGGTTLATIDVASVTTSQAVDAMGNVTTRAAIVAASDLGGVPVRVVVTQGMITLGKTTASGGSYRCTVAFLKVNNP
jgi:hypothetical protein